MGTMFKLALKSLLALVLLLVLLIGALWLRAFKPSAVELMAVTCEGNPPLLNAGQPLRVLSYNVQYMASKNYVFFYDIDQSNPDRVAAVERAGKTLADRPALKDIKWTIEEVASLIEAEQPDVVMLQEINSGDDSRTHFYDQINQLVERVGSQNYPCRADAPYWQAEYILHPNIMGPVDMRLMTLTRHRMTSAVRHQLPRPQINPIERPFYFQRAVLETRQPLTDGSEVAMLNTHFEAWGAGTGVMQRQVAFTLDLLNNLDAAGVPWVLGGDLNLLPPDGQRQRRRIRLAQTGEYEQEPPIRPMYDQYRAIPSKDDLMGEEVDQWYTHIPNDPTVTVPDRTIDYLFYSGQWTLDDARVLHGRSWKVSDHLPVVGAFRLEPED